MKVILYYRYGALRELRLAEIRAPGAPEGRVLVRVTHAALNPKDVVVRRGKFRIVSGRRFPKQCGADLAGVVVESRSPRFSEGERVFGFLDEWTFQRGTLAEVVACRARELAPIPDGVSNADAAGIALAGSTALQALRDVARVRPGARVLVNGASGGVGTAAIQIARLLRCEVHSVSSAANESLCSDLGAHQAWSYPENGWTRRGPFDVIFDVFGNLAFADVRRHLQRNGRFVSTVPTPARLMRNWTSRASSQEERLVIVRPRRDDLTLLATWIAAGSLRTVIDSRFALSSFGEAFARLESKRARGKIIVDVA
jgi:NADPH:quinone reductase-like Zn-dependent oxidoreductase